MQQKYTLVDDDMQRVESSSFSVQAALLEDH